MATLALQNPQTRDRSRIFRSVNLWIIFVLIWTFIAVLQAGQSYIREIMYVSHAPVTRPRIPVKDLSTASLKPMESHFRFFDHLRWSMEIWYTRAAISPLAVWLALTFRIRNNNKWAAIPLHLFFSIAVDGLVLIELATVRHLLEPGSPPFANELKYAFSDHIAFNFLVYWTVVGLAHAWHYSNDSRREELHNARLSEELVKSRLTALKSQVQPHFLFNALHSIGTLVHEDPDAAENMILSLGQLLRASLEDTDSVEVALRKELAILENHLCIERIRFGDRLTVYIDVDPLVLDCAVPHLILQPLVENAIRHGIGRNPGPDRVCISARRAGDSLELEVTNSNSELRLPQDDSLHQGIGLSNSRSRLQELYDQRSSLVLTSLQPRGVSVCVTIPYRPLHAGIDAASERLS
ncbi:MAG TPA: histidine kinase [Granulicella sp.]